MRALFPAVAQAADDRETVGDVVVEFAKGRVGLHLLEAEDRHGVSGRHNTERIPGAFAIGVECDQDEVERSLQFRRVIERSEENTSELQALMSRSYAGLCLKKTKMIKTNRK